jgi:UDP-glucose 4-epimerase
LRVLVTGADGFIGSHLVERLLADGHNVLAMCQYNSAGSRGCLEGVEVETAHADIRDARDVYRLCHGRDVVFHLAALIDIPYSYVAPESYIDTNVKGTLNVLEAARSHGCKVVHTSTSEVYGTPKILPITEEHPLQAQSPYAASKIAADQLALSYHRSFGLDVRVLRPFNTYGPRQSTRGVLAHILTQLLVGARVVALGRIEPRRDFTYISDTVDGLVLAADLPAGETVHLGTGRSVSIAELFELCCQIVGVQAEPIKEPSCMRPLASEVMVLQSDPSKARRLMGWEAKVTLEEGIERTVAWLRSRF